MPGTTFTSARYRQLVADQGFLTSSLTAAECLAELQRNVEAHDPFAVATTALVGQVHLDGTFNVSLARRDPRLALIVACGTIREAPYGANIFIRVRPRRLVAFAAVATLLVAITFATIGGIVAVTTGDWHAVAFGFMPLVPSLWLFRRIYSERRRMWSLMGELLSPLVSLSSTSASYR